MDHLQQSEMGAAADVSYPDTVSAETYNGLGFNITSKGKQKQW